MASSMREKLGVEVPLAHVSRDRIACVHLDGQEPVLQFPQVTSRAGRAAVHAQSTATSNTLWVLDAAAPQELLLLEYGFAADWEDTAARLCFGAPLLPRIGCGVAGGGATQFAAVTADGALHVITAPAGLQQQQQQQQGRRRPSLAAALAAEGGVRSLQLGQHFLRLGAPTTVHFVAGHVCVGTDQGSVLCVPRDNLDESALFELKTGGSGLGKVFGGLFGKPAGQGVCCLATLRHLGEREFLCSVHEEGQLRMWDVGTRRLVYGADLLPPSSVAALLPTHAALTEEPLDPSTSILLVYYEPRSGEGPGELRAYELFVEQRGEATYKVDLESGPQLPGSIYRLHSLALESVGLHTVGAWLLFEEQGGRRRVVCVPLAFGESTVAASSVVQLIEDQLEEAGCSEEAALLCQAVWQAVEAGLGPAAASLLADALPGAFLDVMLAPGRVSRGALHAALRALGGGRSVVGASLEEMQQCDVQELRRALPGWLAAAAAGSAWQANPLGAWCALLRHYAAAWRREHPVVALLQGGLEEEGGLQLVRGGGWLSLIRQGCSPELGLQAELPGSYLRSAAREDRESVSTTLQAAAQLMEALGGHVLGRLGWACIERGLDMRGAVLPAFCNALAAGGGAAPQWVQAGAGRAQWAEWRARCRMLPLNLGQLCDRGDGPTDGFAYAFAAALSMLSQEYVAQADHAELAALTRPIASSIVASAAQVCGARVQCLFQLCLLGSYVCSTQTLGQWSISPQEAQELSSKLLPKAEQMLLAAAVGYWSSVTPLSLPADPSSIDPSQLVIALRIGENGAGASAPKRVRLSASPDSYVADLLLKSQGLVGGRLHVVRDMQDLHSVVLRVAELLSGVTLLASTELGEAPAPSDPSQLVLQVSLELFRGSHNSHLAALLSMLPNSSDARLMFLQACSIARSIPSSSSSSNSSLQRQQRMEESAALFFRAAAIFSNPAAYAEAIKVIAGCIRQLQTEMAGSYKQEGSQALELQYCETVMMLYERLGCPEAASRFALAATKQVPAALPSADQAAARQQRLGRLWANVFAHALEDGKYEEAYAAMLSNIVPEVQLDCMQRLVHSLCNAGRVELLCALPFSATLLVVREGRPTWVTLLDEVVGCLERRAEGLSLDATPQPYKVLYAFHASRGNWQAAAAAMLALSRRLVGEGAGRAGALGQAELALGAAVSALSLVEPSQTWLEDPAGPRAEPSSSSARPLFPLAAPSKELAADGEAVQPPPAILTLDQLRREYAVARAHAAVAAAMPGGEATSSQPDDVFSQLLALGLHDAAVSLAESIYSGSRLTRALEQALASQAAHCTRLQLQSAAVSSGGGSGRAAGGGSAGGHPGLGFGDAGDGMEEEMDAWGDSGMGGGAAAMEDAGEEQEAGVGRGAAGAGAAPAAAAAWRQLKQQLARFEGGEHGNRLRLLIVEAALGTERRLGLPPWLLAPFKAGSGDVAGLVRVLMRFERLEEAAQLAVRHLGQSTRSVPSITMKTMTQQCYPHALLQELAARLESEASSGVEGAQQCHQQLARALQAESEAAARQTAVIGQLFAQ